MCEHLVNALFLKNFPRIHHDDWNYKQDWDAFERQFDQYQGKFDDLFQVTGISGDTIILTCLRDRRTFHVKGLPYDLIKCGFIFNGAIGKKEGDMFWNWVYTNGVYPEKAKNYFILI